MNEARNWEPEISRYLGEPVSRMLEDAPFREWRFVQSVEEGAEEPRISYVFSGHGLQLWCEPSGLVRSMFLRPEATGSLAAHLCDLPFDFDREQVLRRLGVPEKSGPMTKDAILGWFGPWDRFARSEYAIHIQYRFECEGIALITLMRCDTVP